MSSRFTGVYIGFGVGYGIYFGILKAGYWAATMAADYFKIGAPAAPDISIPWYVIAVLAVCLVIDIAWLVSHWEGDA